MQPIKLKDYVIYGVSWEIWLKVDEAFWKYDLLFNKPLKLYSSLAW